jgi:hypothetical protein
MTARIALAAMAAVTLALGGSLNLLGALPPLKVKKDAPRLETGPPPKSTMPATICLDCHRTYYADSFAILHSRQGIRCVDCHGPSEAHKNDEGNITPPDVMFARDDINTACRKCHSVRNRAIPAPISRKRHGEIARIEPKDVMCMDCHGQKHLLFLRNIQWDKKTHKLLPKQGE